jgi:hypothetical protein
MTTKIDDDIKAPLLVLKEGADGIGCPYSFCGLHKFSAFTALRPQPSQ